MIERDQSKWEMREHIPGVSVKRRFGGHNGISTEWELEADYGDRAEILLLLPEIPLIQMGISRFTSWVILPEGVPWDLAGKVVAAWSTAFAGDERGIAHLTRLLVRCYVWGEAFRRHLPVRVAWLDKRFQQWLKEEYPAVEAPEVP